MLCQVQGKRVIKELPIQDARYLTTLFNECRPDFLVILDTTKSSTEVDHAFTHARILFQTLHDTGLTTRTPDDLERLYRDLRAKISSPPQGLGDASHRKIQTLGLWNGAPVPVQLNLACGIFSYGGAAAGWVAGTHTLIPTLGADVFLVAGFDGSTITLGLTGGTLQDLAQFIVIFGFAGILLGCLPTGIIAGIIFLVGFAALYLGIGPPV